MIADYDRALVERLIGALDGGPYELVSPTARGERAAIVVINAGDPLRNEEVYRRLAAEGIDVALRAGNIRLSPHLYNTSDDIERAVAILLASLDVRDVG